MLSIADTPMAFISVCKRYGTKRLFENLNLAFPTGQASCVMGPSGCGKTTLLRLLMGLESPDAGQVICQGRVSAVFQEDRLLEALTARENLRFVVGKGREELIATFLEELEIGDTTGIPVRLFSGGMKRRVAIGRALLAEHDILLLDEPFKGLDAGLKQRVAKVILRHAQGKTLLLVTHEPSEALLFDAFPFRLP